MPAALAAATSPAGQTLLREAEYTADYDALLSAYVSQVNISYCGVASGVTVLKAFGRQTSQSEFFTPEASAVRSRWQVTFGGMTLDELAGLLGAHGIETKATHGDALSLDAFRTIVERNLGAAGDFLLVNYQRQNLDQEGSGHISPVAAYNASADQVLVLDTASFKYPYTWVPVELLYDALQDVDPASGRPRGILELSL